MIEVCFSVNDWDDQKLFPKCNYMNIDQGGYLVSLQVPLDDPRIEINKDRYMHKVSSNNHSFDDTGYPRCKICGWSPMDTTTAGDCSDV